MARPYEFKKIEPKWQKFWQAKKVFRAVDPGDADFDPDQPKYYVLGMFPYPSGAGLHVGHPESYTAVDVLARYKRMRGYNVLNPMGWDSFGLPAEQYAIKTNFPPAAMTQNSINIFRSQLMALGYSYDWERELASSSPDYYKWTQWFFTKIFEKGLAYEDEKPVWWCEELGTVLANEEVDADGLSEVGHYPCVRRPMRQWMMRITEYAERLLEGLERVDWPDHIKRMQREWIGRSTGADVDFTVAEGPAAGEKMRIFTTRPDTLFGATYMVLAPEHELVEKVTTDEQREAVRAYVEAAARKSERVRISETEKTGVFTGGYATNPVNGGKIPIWISDYVLISYGTGAIMAVPAHDDRDFAFAKTFGLPIIEVVEPPADAKYAVEGPGPGERCFTGDGLAVNSGAYNGLATPDFKEAIAKDLEAKGLGKKVIRYRLRDWLFSRQRYWGEPIPILHREDGSLEAVPKEQLPLTLPPLKDFRPSGDFQPPLGRVKEWVRATDAAGKPARRETNVMPQWAGSCWYFARFVDARNAEAPWSEAKERYWMPVDMYIGGAEHAVLHLLYSRFWHKALYDMGLVHNDEPFAALFNQGMIRALAYKTRAGAFIAPDRVKWDGQTPRHPETGEELEAAVVKMSKSLGNVVNPDEVVRDYGADTLRCYLLGMGPLEVDKPWNTRDIAGQHRFLWRVWRLYVGAEKETFPTPIRPHLLEEDQPLDEGLERLLHKTIKKVTEDIEKLRFNTAISQMIIFVNEATKNPEAFTRSQAERFIKLLSPFAPHLAEELWISLGNVEFLARGPWPEWDPARVAEETVELPVQVNGKMRGTIQVPADADEAACVAAAREVEVISRWLEPGIKKVIFVPGRMLNLIVAKKK